MKLTVGLSDVAPWGSAPVKKDGGSLKSNVPSSTESRPRETPLRIEETICDLRGKRVEEGLGLVDSFLDELLRRQEVGGYVLHGHGTGAMKEAVRQHLRAHAVIETSRACERDEGGDAFTVFWLRGMS
jgi:DNA mismatch repair protein MutS2